MKERGLSKSDVNTLSPGEKAKIFHDENMDARQDYLVCLVTKQACNDCFRELNQSFVKNNLKRETTPPSTSMIPASSLKAKQR